MNSKRPVHPFIDQNSQPLFIPFSPAIQATGRLGLVDKQERMRIVTVLPDVIPLSFGNQKKINPNPE
jgi:hypothetical protein